MARSASDFTYADLREMPEDGRRYEVVEGDLLASPSPKVSHQRVVKALYRLLERAERAGFGELVVAPADVFFDEHNAVVPDAVFVARDRVEIVMDDALRGAPDLIAEVLSPSTRAGDLGPKPRLYQRAGVRFYWVADPEARTVAVYKHQGTGRYAEPLALEAGDVLRCPLFPGIEIPVADLFAR